MCRYQDQPKLSCGCISAALSRGPVCGWVAMPPLSFACLDKLAKFAHLTQTLYDPPGVRNWFFSIIPYWIASPYPAPRLHPRTSAFFTAVNVNFSLSLSLSSPSVLGRECSHVQRRSTTKFKLRQGILYATTKPAKGIQPWPRDFEELEQQNECAIARSVLQLH
jgi:hypothetical protein